MKRLIRLYRSGKCKLHGSSPQARLSVCLGGAVFFVLFDTHFSIKTKTDNYAGHDVVCVLKP